MCGLSRTRFSALFTKTMGTSFGQFCLQIRLGHVARLLLTTDRTIETIADGLEFLFHCPPASAVLEVLQLHPQRVPAREETS